MILFGLILMPRLAVSIGSHLCTWAYKFNIAAIDSVEEPESIIFINDSVDEEDNDSVDEEDNDSVEEEKYSISSSSLNEVISLDLYRSTIDTIVYCFLPQPLWQYS